MAATAIVVPFHDVDAVVGRFRRELTRDGAEGMPAHVTLIYPFADDSHIGGPEIARLRAALVRFSAFGVRFARFDRFAAVPPVLYLEPEPGDPFVEMIAALTREFPAFPPFGGIHETVVPHLTVAQTDDVAAMRAAEVQVAGRLPIRTHVAEATLMEQGVDGWRIRDRMPLPPAD